MAIYNSIDYLYYLATCLTTVAYLGFVSWMGGIQLIFQTHLSQPLSLFLDKSTLGLYNSSNRFFLTRYALIVLFQYCNKCGSYLHYFYSKHFATFHKNLRLLA